tara:strand:+ start:68 stop:868 length:801 start_codon:yes stop_codon:yes gene_type:complete
MKKLNELIDEIEEQVEKHIGEGVTHKRSKRIKQRTDALAYGKFGKTLRQCTKKEVLSIHEFLGLKIEEEEEETSSYENPWDTVERTKDRVPMTQSMRKDVMAKTKGHCAECNDPLNSERDGNTAIDHIKPKCFYGEDTIDNLRALCEPCHKFRNLNPAYQKKMKLMQGIRTASGMWAGHPQMGLFNAAQLIWNSHHNTYHTKEEVVYAVNDALDKAIEMSHRGNTCDKCGVYKIWHDDEIDGHEFVEIKDYDKREEEIRKAMELTV